MKYVVFDTETSGLDFKEDKILSCHAQVWENDELVHQDTWYLDWDIDVPEEASAVNGLTREWLNKHGRKDVEECILEIYETVFSVNIIAAYNLPFDMTMLYHHAKNQGIPIEYDIANKDNIYVDPLVIDKKVDRYRKGKRNLAVVAEHYGFEVEESRLHDATYDVEMTQKLVAMFLKRWKLPISRLRDEVINSALEQQYSLEKYFKKKENDPNYTISKGFPIYV